jgi:hypothetical protein
MTEVRTTVRYTKNEESSGTREDFKAETFRKFSRASLLPNYPNDLKVNISANIGT